MFCLCLLVGQFVSKISKKQALILGREDKIELNLLIEDSYEPSDQLHSSCD